MGKPGRLLCTGFPVLGSPQAGTRKYWSLLRGRGGGSSLAVFFNIFGRPLRGTQRGHRAMRLLPVIKGATWCCAGRFGARRFSSAARRGERPGGEELSRLRLDDLAPTPRLELLFGLSPCLLALRAARRRVARVLLQAGRAGVQGERAELLRAAEARNIPVLRHRRQKLDALCRYQVHQGVCMEVSPLRPRPWSEAGETSPGDGPQQLWLVLEGLQDPRNLGAVLRSAYFLGVDKVITSRRNRHGRPLFSMCPTWRRTSS